MLAYNEKKHLEETEYVMHDETKNASLFTTGNGYMGVRGSFEEFGTSKAQGFFVRGLIDEIVEIVEPRPDNIYMRKYYFDEEKLKKFDKQDSCINIADILLVRFTVGGKTFFPWEGKILSWERYLDASEGILHRNVTWDDGDGNITEFSFSRFASYADEHKYIIKATATPVNHKLNITAASGIDLNVRTNGQIKTELNDSFYGDGGVYADISIGKKYGFNVSVASVTKFPGAKNTGAFCKDGLLCQTAEFTGAATVEKCAYVATDRDNGGYGAKNIAFKGYEEEKKAHLEKWTEIFSYFDIEICGDDKSDAAVRYANYQTVITASLGDSVHSLSAKGLTGEKYNQFVWWDCEIYQLPIFLLSRPEAVKHALEYRYRLLPAARENAREQGYKGARYPFVSSVDGKEHVWIYARHPFLQIHIMADIAYAVLEYYDVTGDEEFMREKGFEMLIEIMRFWLSRAEFTNGRYEIKDVTGTDEHHLHVDNDAYTNYTVKTCFDRAIKIVGGCVSDKELAEFKNFAEKLYLPLCENGLIPQFDGYFDLSEKLEKCGNGTGKNFQMKDSGLYHKCRIIKQPDVTLLYSYINAGLDEKYRALNCDYYENMCEASSSLTYPVNAVCAALNDRPYAFLKYLDDAVNVDVKDTFGTAYQGLHSGCMAGGRYAVLRAIIGVNVIGGALHVNPAKMPFWKSVKLKFTFRGADIYARYENGALELTTDSDETFEIVHGGVKKEFYKKITIGV